MADPTNPPAQAPPGFTDHTYATKHGVPLGVRVWVSPAATVSSPWVLWSHGGAFLVATHHTPMPWLHNFLEHGVHIVSYGYRLGPHAKLRDILEDSQSALDWARENLPLITDGHVNIDVYSVAGESAGGCIAALNGQVLRPPPRSVINLYGPVDFTDPHFDFAVPLEALPDAYSGKFTPEELEAELKSSDLSRALDGVPHIHLGIESEEAGVDNFRQRARLDKYKYTDREALQNDLHILAVTTGRLLNSLTEPVPGAVAKDVRWTESPLGRLDKWKGTHPPTIILHGTGDIAVPVAQSIKYASRLRELGTEVEEVYAPDEAHIFDIKYTRPDVPGWDEHIAPLINFTLRHLRGGEAAQAARYIFI